ncbi:hypothetical protein N7449_000283 [Penicillium cf. viridicatum]|uniref:Uncharacterized protein n=1 Tax=Penicillium cf. viridicatum TaxID=2972119 RepID=A0A9W9N5F3_9EURO|nr:hypothetical protein N7449_000283 [Penicillium cf. viridicatum]
MVRCFEITEDLTMEFEGESCNILNADGVVEELGPRDGIVTREIYINSQTRSVIPQLLNPAAPVHLDMLKGSPSGEQSPQRYVL